MIHHTLWAVLPPNGCVIEWFTKYWKLVGKIQKANSPCISWRPVPLLQISCTGGPGWVCCWLQQIYGQLHVRWQGCKPDAALWPAGRQHWLHKEFEHQSASCRYSTATMQKLISRPRDSSSFRALLIDYCAIRTYQIHHLLFNCVWCKYDRYSQPSVFQRHCLVTCLCTPQ